MPNLRELLTVILIGASTFGLIENSNGDFSSIDCPTGPVNMSLDLVNVGLTHLPDGFIKNEFLTHLTLDRNEIAAVSSETFSSVPRLSYLSLAYNSLTSLNLDPFTKLSNLRILVLDGNCKRKIVKKYLPPANDNYDYDGDNRFGTYGPTTSSSYEEINYCSFKFDVNISSLTHLHLEDNDLQKLSFESGELPALTHLYLSTNPLVMINRAEMLGLNRFAPALTHLYLRNCGLIVFDAFQLPSLTALHLDGNEIGLICNDHCFGWYLRLKNSEKLETLSVFRNDISKIESDSFNFTTNLRALDLSHNRISKIRRGTFDKLHRLQSLSLEYNHFAEQKPMDIFGGLINLESLYLGATNLTAIAGGLFHNLSQLKYLMLNNSKLSDIDSEIFSNLTRLEVLSLAGNQLSTIPAGSLPTSGSLITLDLDNNRFTSTEHIDLDNQPKLISLSLKNNPLTDISARWFLNGPANLTVLLGNNC